MKYSTTEGYPMDEKLQRDIEAARGVKPADSGGGLTGYYLVRVENPQRTNQPPYTAECEDLIEALGLDFDEGNIFKELWRNANARKNGNGKPGNTPLRAADKIEHYAKRIALRARRFIAAA